MHHGYLAVTIPWFVFSLIFLGVTIYRSDSLFTSEVFSAGIVCFVLSVMVLIFIPKENKKIALVIFENGIYCPILFLRKNEFFMRWDEIENFCIEKIRSGHGYSLFLKIYPKRFQAFYNNLKLVEKLKYRRTYNISIHNEGLALKVLGVLDVSEDILLELLENTKARYDHQIKT